jgi:hypothetical protein
MFIAFLKLTALKSFFGLKKFSTFIFLILALKGTGA